METPALQYEGVVCVEFELNMFEVSEDVRLEFHTREALDVASFHDNHGLDWVPSNFQTELLTAEDRVRIFE